MTVWIFSCRLLPVVVLLLNSLSFGQASPADLILVNGNIRTMDRAKPKADALAVSDGRFIAVGTNEQVRRHAGEKTRVIDAKGKLVLPGFNDSHVHFAAVGNKFSSIDLRSARSVNEIGSKISEYVRFLPKGRWVLGGGWNEGLLKDGGFTREALDSIATEHPVFIYSSTNQTAIANRVALAKARLTALTPSPSGGEIGRLPNGEPNGILIGKALDLVASIVPADHARIWPEVLQTASNYAASLGVTSVQDLHSDELDDLYRELNRKGKLRTRVYDCAPISSAAKLATVGTKAATGDAMVRTGCVKYFSDGDEAEADDIRRKVADADKAGLQVMVHAIGGPANSIVLNAFEAAIKENGPRDRRFRVEHAAGFSLTDLERYERAKIILSMQPILFFTEGLGVADNFRRLLDAGVPLVFGADAPMRGFDPLEGIFAAVNAGGRRGIAVEEAVYAHTLGAAYAEFQEKEKGSIEVGKLADLVLLSDDIFEDVKNIRAAKVVATVVNGLVVYENTK
ncbi:MAG TPA: amidohydrolase [Pyrinomonadaceae bacterium]|nr:amidohydrolase [Pyrinomonadaceae bacterium]